MYASSHCRFKDCATNNSGLTLVEFLVVTILIGMVSSILYQGLAQIFRIERRLDTNVVGSQQKLMVTNWFRQSLQGLTPDQQAGLGIFKGSPHAVSGLTTNGFTASRGAISRIKWEIKVDKKDRKASLVYQEGDKTSTVLNWRTPDVKFVFFDAANNPYTRWPPELGLFDQLPSRIHLVAEADDGHSVVVATPQGVKNPPLPSLDIL